MSIDWSTLGQDGFDRAVEVLVLRRFKDGVRAVNGRGGDDGIDIEILRNGVLRILQLKYFPEGFSGGFRDTRRRQIKESFERALVHQPAEWSLVVPCVLTNSEDKYVKSLRGKRRMRVSSVDRDELDDWLIDDTNLDAYFQRTPIQVLMNYAVVFNQERASVIRGVDDIRARIEALANVIDTVDPYWAYGFGSEGGATSITARPINANVPVTAGFRVTLKSQLDNEQTAILAALQENIGYATAGPIRISRDMVESVSIEGPAILAGEHPSGDVEILHTAGTPGVGQTLELRTYDQDGGQPASFEGEITHADSGALGRSLDVAFCERRLHVKFRFPHHENQEATFAAKAELSFSIPKARPSVIQDLLFTARQITGAGALELYIDGAQLTRAGGIEPVTIEEYGLEKLIIEQFAYDLDILQRHCHTYFDIPETISGSERVAVRVGRILAEGGIVASPRVRTLTMMLAGDDSPKLREVLSRPSQVHSKIADTYVVKVANKTLPIGQVYAVHPKATATNGEEAIAALDAGTATKFPVTFVPGDDHFFFVALANQPIEDYLGKRVTLWGLIDIEQPDVPPSQGEHSAGSADGTGI